MIAPFRFRDASTTGEPATRPRLIGELGVLVLLLVVYDYLRTLTRVRRPPAFHHGLQILEFERDIAMNVEVRFNHWLSAQQNGLGWLSVGYYQFLHIGAALAILGWCYIRRPDIYRPARNTLVATNVVGLLVFALYPVAPPRLLPDAGIVDMVARAGFGSSHGPVPINEFGAMPSLHLAWAVWVAIVGLQLTRARWSRWLLLLHPVITAVVVVGTGNHYLVDVVAGALLGLVAAVGSGLLNPLRTSGRIVGLGDERPGWMLAETAVSQAAGSAARHHTLVAFHAHPDDETFLTGGTLASAASAGHRTVIVVATAGEAGLTETGVEGDALGERRMVELRAAAAILGCQRVEWLGYGDSGRDGNEGGADTFVLADPEIAAARLAAILNEEHADVLTIYDPAGGYGHPDHVQVHQVGRRAAELAGTPVVLEATVDRRAMLRLTRALRVLPGLPPEFRPTRLRQSFSVPDRLTHRIDVRSHLVAKRAAMAAHVSQRTGGSTPRSLSVFLRLPEPLFRRIFGHEWFVEIGRQPGPQLVHDVFATLSEGTP